MSFAKPVLVGGLLVIISMVGIPYSFAHTGHGNDEMPVIHDEDAASSVTDELLADERQASILLDLGAHTFPVSTKNKLAQQFINQGLNLAYGFNHAEAGRAFKEAARLDPKLAMAYWGQALVLGPNINAPMDANEEPLAVKLINQAKALMVTASPKEQALIQALEKRYSGIAEARKLNDQAYADAMRGVHHQFPGDPDIAVLYVESTMNLRPWGYWMRDGYPYAGTADIVALTEDILRRYPNHPGALHMYIHLMEPTPYPERAEQAADALLTLMPQAGHMIHMSSHIYQRVGRYADAVRSNQMAIQADEEYIAQFKAQGLYPLAYYPHNIHFLWFAASASGQYALALKSARDTAEKIDDALLQQFPFTSIFRVLPYWTLARFGQWQSVLDEPAPPADNAFLAGSWHYVRGLAYVAMGKLKQAATELAQLRKIVGDSAQLDYQLLSQNTAYAVLRIAPEVLAGELAAAHGKFDTAITHLERAVRLEDGLVYTEPFEWHYPPRLSLGAILLEAGHPDEAETVYWADLRHNRNNGWALFGLQQALQAQNKTTEAEAVAARFKEAWQHSDITLSASRMGR